MVKKTFILLLALVFIFSLSIPSAVNAEEGGEGGFTDNFDGPTLDGWERSQDVVVSDGVLNISPGNMAFRGGNFPNPSISFKLKKGSPGEIIFHYHASDSGSYNLILHDSGVFLEKFEEGSGPTMLGEYHAENMGAGDWMTVSISLTGNAHTITLDGETVITAQDESPIQAGGIGFEVHGESPSQFDDLSVSATMAEPMLIGEEGEPAEGDGEPGEMPPEGEEPMEGEPVHGEEAGEMPISDQPPLATQEPAPGGLDGIISKLFSVQVTKTDLATHGINLLLSALLAYILGVVYVHWGASLTNRRKFAANFMIMTLTTTFIILVVRSSVALSLGLVGALSIVRFRAAIKEPEELAYLFLAIGIGIGLGDNQRLVTLISFTVAICVLGLLRLLKRSQADVNLHLNIAVRAPQKIDLDQVMTALKPHCSKLKLLRFDENQKAMELSFLVEFKHVSNLNQARDAVRKLAGDVDITFLDNKGVW